MRDGAEPIGRGPRRRSGWTAGAAAKDGRASKADTESTGERDSPSRGGRGAFGERRVTANEPRGRRSCRPSEPWRARPGSVGEEREARLVKRIEELQRGMVTVSPVVGCSEGDQRQQQASGEPTREGERAVREELGSPRYAVSIQEGRSEPGRGEHKRGAYSHPGSLTSERPRTGVPFPAETAVLPARPHPVPHSSDLVHPNSPHPAFYPGLPTTQRKQMEGQGEATLTQQTEES